MMLVENTTFCTEVNQREKVPTGLRSHPCTGRSSVSRARRAEHYVP
jgi:hypothetical protein